VVLWLVVCTAAGGNGLPHHRSVFRHRPPQWAWWNPRNGSAIFATAWPEGRDGFSSTSLLGISTRAIVSAKLSQPTEILALCPKTHKGTGRSSTEGRKKARQVWLDSPFWPGDGESVVTVRDHHVVFERWN
jgi:hypothetical protein